MRCANAETFPVITIISNMFRQLVLPVITTETLKLLTSNRGRVNPVALIESYSECNAVDNLTPRG